MNKPKSRPYVILFLLYVACSSLDARYKPHFTGNGYLAVGVVCFVYNNDDANGVSVKCIKVSC
jgi:hypothetical protein